MKFFVLLIASLSLGILISGCVPYHYAHHHGHYYGYQGKGYAPFRGRPRSFRYRRRARNRYEQCDIY